MYELAHPWALSLLILPLAMRLLPAYRETRDSVRVPFFDKLVELSEQRPGSGAMILRRVRLKANTAKPGRFNGRLTVRGVINVNVPFSDFPDDVKTGFCG